ncbi:FAD-dependent oxidoreductase [Aspergillus thermomutatus]|uniref:FAD-binding domain-containing protein n=1 Tax=Aspergillus thermomutatus TaxID=41047 RepID=A0A397H3A1_ASPTH|nr:uncharacterized protein CDV56_100634 [Aspergillus thermomutatus]RHZ54870.1 hypothetical protein CDV56_100634 [Aspergillus thermomutatus]ULE36155.1 ThmM [Aspergillus thermomutatus]
MTVSSSSGPAGVAPPHSSGIRVIVVGLGIGGLAAAIECHRKGHTVRAFDKRPVHTQTKGDLLGLSTNSARVVSKWGNGAIHEILYNIKNGTGSTLICDKSGKPIVPADMTGVQKNDGYWVLRSTLASVLFEHAKSLGIDLHVGPEAEVSDYWESEDEAGVIVNGKQYTADCVICCDGINSKGRQLILKEDPPFIPTAEHAFRTSFATKELAMDSEAKWLLEGTEETDLGKIFKGPGLEIGFSSFENGRDFVLVAMYNGENAIQKLGKLPDNLDDVGHLMSDWPIRSKFEAVFKYAPQENTLHHPLAMRAPLKTWVSSGGRMIVIGDAAHALLPILGQGGSQAIEDAAAIAITLELAGKSNVPLALQIAEKIRKPRATIIQQSSRVVHDEWYNQDWDAVAKDPTSMKSSRPGWILNHNCQVHTYEEYERALHAIQTGQEYIPRDLPMDGQLGIADKMTTWEKYKATTDDKPCFLEKTCL